MVLSLFGDLPTRGCDVDAWADDQKIPRVLVSLLSL